MEYEPVIGLEVHAQLLTRSKIFCGCSTSFGAPPNTHTCPVCLGMPGVLPVLNKQVVEFAIKMALATNCQIAPLSRFARKNYFYPDLPKGYQISQYELPLAEHGFINIEVNGSRQQVRIRRIHMEEDAGKLIHDEQRPVSYVDFNRTGVPLIEIVSEPDLHSPEAAVEYLRNLRNILLYLEICDGNMEEGSLRCDANISLRPLGTLELGTRTELKNMNSFRHLQRALDYEIRRQRALLLNGEAVVQETRLWDEAQSKTFSMRGKEEAHDYRYFPDPDLVPVEVSPEWIEAVRLTLPELPEAKKARFVADYGLPEYDAGVLTGEKLLAQYFEDCVRELGRPKQVSNWIMSELLRELKKTERGMESCQVTPVALARLLDLVEQGTISGKMAKAVFEEMVATGQEAEAIIKARGLVQISDEAALEALAREILTAHTREVAEYKGGKTKLMGFFVGQMMKKTKGQANPRLVNQLFQRLLQE
ncbi:MAG: Asp-tRNA(Asn)/Glu-tRNA(Gln) amidotransferase subunit GatB [Deltaproteobacteria bacterium]|nr:Asp-tRNA(Asn)/Glu-tRNA(Gln) amidotransferase subunit GatB [Deltaproteobacteria bacterium]MBW1953196.1 Asp-tRNA(Asn)/Glu-tRNA(Gln) amidotransferase subunit GatB [Deltaproteobacteria bacterium]MBW1985980.1 Asp-tRNA(Asn)/Glu-tRNA(Gln) amidotransferase subunit GatB [Deltaproteobacteria bacterium]MBW2134858.1 Asp-tRNA(Asn)/Glu-tRNA(Gln) amidotransferase subunit GatB [Deltaproteobacteria bacterium]